MKSTKPRTSRPKLHTTFQKIVMGALVATTSGCTSCECKTQEVPASWRVQQTENSPEVDEAIAADLAEFLEATPTADANAQLEHLFAGPNAMWTGEAINPQVKSLIDEATMDGSISLAACEGMCASFYGKMVTSCIGPEMSSEDVLLCEGMELRNCGGAGRLPHGAGDEEQTQGSLTGRWWAHVSYLEKAAVHAFAQMAHELRLLNAPQSLIDRCLDAAVDEVVHARLCAAQAARHGVRPAQVVMQNEEPLGLFEFALQNATEGCVRETYAGLEATWQAENCEDDIRPMMDLIARDECGHAELSWDIHDWALSLLDSGQAAVIQEAQTQALSQLKDDVKQRDGFVPTVLGLPEATIATALLDAMNTTLGGA